jgi:hypothetical protein
MLAQVQQIDWRDDSLGHVLCRSPKPISLEAL